jgi:uncharacterized protein (DUF58 family)
MDRWPEEAALRALHGRMRHAAGAFAAAVPQPHLARETGQWLGTGIGSSIDFQDHRQYLPGDDPRYIDWQAYARTGHYTMKVYREEVSRVWICADLSRSMCSSTTPSGSGRWTLYFASEARCTPAPPACHAVSGTAHRGS